MSEEQINEVQNEHKCNCAIFKTLSVLAILLSIISIVLSILTYTGNSITLPLKGKRIVISKMYDKGQSLEKAKEMKKPILVFFYTDWCGFCQRFAPTFKKITKDSKIKKNFAVAYVNCEKAENAKLMEEYEVDGFPTVFVIKEDGTKTRLENSSLFFDNAEEAVKEDILKLIEKE